jgi:hypothetical protein
MQRNSQLTRIWIPIYLISWTEEDDTDLSFEVVYFVVVVVVVEAVGLVDHWMRLGRSHCGCLGVISSDTDDHDDHE